MMFSHMHLLIRLPWQLHVNAIFTLTFLWFQEIRFGLGSFHGNMLIGLLHLTFFLANFLPKLIRLSHRVCKFILNKPSFYSINSSSKINIMAVFWTLSRFSDSSMIRELCQTTQQSGPKRDEIGPLKTWGQKQFFDVRGLTLCS